MPPPNTSRGGGPYRSRQGIIFGVCRGLADYFGLSVFWVRVFVLLAMLFTGFWPVGIAYLVAGMVIKLEPVLPLESDDDAEFYHAYATSRSLAVQRLKRTYEHLDRRIQRLEGIVTGPEYNWDRRLDETDGAR
jgi:phage shock protein C